MAEARASFYSHIIEAGGTYNIMISAANDRFPSLPMIIIYLLVYSFAALPIALVAFYIFIKIGISSELLKDWAVFAHIFTQLIISIVISAIILYKYTAFVLGSELKLKYHHFIRSGLKWSIPYLAGHLIMVATPTVRSTIYERLIVFSYDPTTGTGLYAHIAFSTVVIIAAICEEIIFRGLLLHKLTYYFTNLTSVIISSVLFALLHSMSYTFSIANQMSFFIAGILFGYAFLSTKSVISAIIPHLLHNIFCVIYLWLFMPK